MLQPTAIEFYVLPKPTSKVVAYVNITFDDTLVVKDFKIINGEKGLFLGFPSKQDKKDPKKFFDTVYVAQVGTKESPGPGWDWRNKLNDWAVKKYSAQTAANKPAFEDQTKSPGPAANGYKDKVPF